MRLTTLLTTMATVVTCVLGAVIRSPTIVSGTALINPIASALACPLGHSVNAGNSKVEELGPVSDPILFAVELYNRTQQCLFTPAAKIVTGRQGCNNGYLEAGGNFRVLNWFNPVTAFEEADCKGQSVTVSASMYCRSPGFEVRSFLVKT